MAQGAAQAPLTREAAPQGVVVRFRIADPEALADAAFDAMAVPYDWRKGMAEIDTIFAPLSAVDLKGAVEGAVVLNPERPVEPFRFVSVGAKGVDETLAALEKEGIPIEEGGAGNFYFQLEAQSCAVGRSLGKSAARVVCSDDRAGLRYLLGYALRGLPAEPLSKAEVFFEADVVPLSARYGNELKRGQLLASVGARSLHVGHPKLDRALTDAAVGLADELGKLIVDADKFRIELFRQGVDYDLRMSMSFRGMSSTFVQDVKAMKGQQAATPDFFANLPNTAQAASYSREMPKERSEAWMSILVDLVTGYAEYKGVSPAFSSRLGSVTKQLGPLGRTSVMAHGPLVRTQHGDDTTLARAWSVWGTSQPMNEMVENLDNWAWLLSSNEWQKIYPELTELPSFKRAPTRAGEPPKMVVYEWSIPEKLLEKLDRLDATSTNISSIKWRDILKGRLNGFVGVQELDGVTWLFTVEGKERAALLESSRAMTNKDVARLSGTPVYAELQKQPAVAAGFSTLEGVVGLFSMLIPARLAKDWPGLLRATPNGGTRPMTYAYTVKTDNGVEAVWTARVPQAFIRDAATLTTLITVDLAR